MLERQRSDEALLLRVADVMVAVPEAGEPQTAQNGNRRRGPDRQARLKRLLVVRLRLVVSLAVVHAEMEVAVVRRKREPTRQADVGGDQKPLALDENLSLETVAVDALVEVDVRRLLHPEAEPGSVR